MRKAFIEELLDVAARDERVWLLTADLGFSVVEPFAERFPDRYLNAGVAEQNMTGIAAGLAHSGNVVFTYSIANFPTLRCLEQIRNDVCYHELPVKVVAVGGGVAYGALGYSHHAVEDLAIMRTLPGMTVLAPGDPVETRLCVDALVADPGPGYLRLGKAGEQIVHAEPPPFAIGRAIPMRDGDDVTLISTGGVLPLASAAADALARDGLSVRLLSMPTVEPLDREAVLAAGADTRLVCTVEEHAPRGGLSDAVARVLAESPGCAPLLAMPLALPETGRVGGQEYLRRSGHLEASEIASRVTRALEQVGGAASTTA